jgi:hypothetical protein
MLAIIHDIDSDPKLSDAKVMFYQELLDPDAYWIRKEYIEVSGKRTAYVETNCFGASEALNGFEISTNMMLSRLSSRNRRLHEMCGEGC